MTPTSDEKCPLCGRPFPRQKLHGHICSESPRMRHRTVQVIQGHYPDWTMDHGSCETCWRSFRNAAQVMVVLQNAKRGNAADAWARGPTVAEPPPPAQLGETHSE